MVPNIHYFLNLDNSLCDRNWFPRWVSTDSDSIYGVLCAMDPRATITAPAKDWLILKSLRPEAIDLINERRICVLPSFFSNMVPQMFPDLIRVQIEESARVLKKLFEHICWWGIVPENMVYSGMVEGVKDVWEGVLYAQYESKQHGKSDWIDPGAYALGDGAHTIPLVAMANEKARRAQHQMYKGEITADEAVQTFEESVSGASTAISKGVYTDFERPWTNRLRQADGTCVADNGRLAWVAFNEAVAKCPVVGHESLKTLSKNDLEETRIPSRDPLRWETDNSTWFYRLQREVIAAHQGKGDYLRLACLVAASCNPCRVLSRFLELDHFQGPKGMYAYVPDLGRVAEYLHILSNITKGRDISYCSDMLSSEQRTYVDVLHACLIEDAAS
jgi:hypothetical protein